MNESDESLVLQSQSGDRASFEELVRRTARSLYAKLYIETGSSHQAEDLVQETYLRAWKKLHQLTEAKGFRGWLFTIAHTVLVDSVRRGRRRKRLAPMIRDLPLDAAGSADTPPESAERKELRQRVLSKLRAMPERLRLPLTLRFIAGSDYESISKELGLTNGSLRGLLSRGLAQLREVFRDEAE